MKLQEPYRTRAIRFLGLWNANGWRLKVYGIAYRGERPGSDVVAAAKTIAIAALPQPPHTEGRYGVGFLIIHEGRDGYWVLLDWWEHECVVHHKLFEAPLDKPYEMRAVTNGMMACTWELAVFAFERQAWIDAILDNRAGPDIEGYLGVQYNADV